MTSETVLLRLQSLHTPLQIPQSSADFLRLLLFLLSQNNQRSGLALPTQV